MVNQTVPNPRSLIQGAAADKAVIALIAMRQQRGVFTRGVGPNRDDLPLFADLVEGWAAGQGGDKERIMQARARVTKYGRQLSQSSYWGPIQNPEISRAIMIELTRSTLSAAKAERELQSYIRGQDAYGNW